MNFVIFVPDEMRAESVGCYGHPLAPTPNMDRLAAQGVRFEQCHVQHTVCTPSRCSFMTGWYPHVRGHRTLWHGLRPDEPNLLKYMKSAGYQVHWYGRNDLLARASFADSVTSIARVGGSGVWGRNPYKPDDPRRYTFLSEPFAEPVSQHNDYALVDAAASFLRSKPTEPFVLYIPITFPHCPYSAPRPWHDMIDPDKLPALRPPDRPGKPLYHQLIRQTRRLNEVDDATFRKIQAVYLGMISFTDHLLGMLDGALEETGLSKSTALFTFADHGDWAGDYGLVEKWPSALEDVLTRVPLLARVPGGKAGHVVREQVEAFDVMATILDLAGIRAKHAHFAKSLKPQIEGSPGDPNRAVFAEGGYARHEPNCFEGKSGGDMSNLDKGNVYYPKLQLQQDHPESVARSAMIRTLDHKLVCRHEGGSELYDLKRDPRELDNRWDDPAYAETRRTLESRLLDWYVETSDVTPFDEDPRGMPPRAEFLQQGA